MLVNLPGTVFSEAPDQPLIGPGTQPYSGSDTGDIPFAINNENFQMVLTITWTGGSAMDVLTINVPNNSIDLAIIPEPTSMALLGFAGIGLVSRRRR